MEIKLHEGLDKLVLGMVPEQAEQAWGKPTEIENIEDEDGSLLVWHYDEKETSLSFDPFFENRLTGIAVSSEELRVQGEEIMGKSEMEVLHILESLGIKDLEGEEMEDGATMFLSFESGMSLFFEDNELLEVKIAPDFDEETEEIIWPKG